LLCGLEKGKKTDPAQREGVGEFQNQKNQHSRKGQAIPHPGTSKHACDGEPDIRRSMKWAAGAFTMRQAMAGIADGQAGWAARSLTSGTPDRLLSGDHVTPESQDSVDADDVVRSHGLHELGAQYAP
jgi:hypothetical protein